MMIGHVPRHAHAYARHMAGKVNDGAHSYQVMRVNQLMYAVCSTRGWALRLHVAVSHVGLSCM